MKQKTIILGILTLFTIIFFSNCVYGALTYGLISYYTFDNNSFDSFGYQNSTLSNAVQISGKINNGYSITSATNSYINFGSPTKTDFMNNAPFSFNLWIQVSASTGGAECLIHHNNIDVSNDAPYLICLNTTIPNTIESFNGASWYIIANPSDINKRNDGWKMLTITYNGSIMKAYVNGALNGSVAYTYTGNSDQSLKLGGWNADGPTYNYGGGLDEFGVWNRSLSSFEIEQLYNGGAGLVFPFFMDIGAINCTSCNPPEGDSVSPYETDDTTPTFRFNTSNPSACRISDMNINYTTMGSSRDCDTGQSIGLHTCTLTAQDALTDYNTSVYLSCNYVESINATMSLSMLISSLETPNSAEAIMQGIENSVIGQGATIYSNQKVYLRMLNGSSVTATVAKVVVYGNQRWLFNYVNDTGNILGLFNISPVVYSLDMKNISMKAIRGNVTALINSTKS